MRQPHTPVRYIDRLNTLRWKLTRIAVGIEDTDIEVSALLHRIGTDLGNVAMLINREEDDPVRQAHRGRLKHLETEVPDYSFSPPRHLTAHLPKALRGED
jgi:hypothetical protein